jgi:prepilin-type N-terminal cleavage/methylation domain-containing protein
MNGHFSRAQRNRGQRQRRRAGFTLLELMVVFLIFSMVVMALYAILSGGRRAWLTSEAQIDLQVQARRALARITQDLSESAPSQISIVTISPQEDRITFRMASSYTGGVVTWGNQIRYALGGINGQQLIRQDLDSGGSEEVAQYVTALLFAQPDADTIDVGLTVARQSLVGDTLQLPLATRITLRNR